MLQENADRMLLFKFFHLKNKRKGIFEFLFGMLFTVLTATFSCLLMSPRMNRSVCEIISKHYIVRCDLIPDRDENIVFNVGKYLSIFESFV